LLDLIGGDMMSSRVFTLEATLKKPANLLYQDTESGIRVINGDYGVTIEDVHFVRNAINELTREDSLKVSANSLHNYFVVLFRANANYRYALELEHVEPSSIQSVIFEHLSVLSNQSLWIPIYELLHTEETKSILRVGLQHFMKSHQDQSE
jgi:hypothetical protein